MSAPFTPTANDMIPNVSNFFAEIATLLLNEALESFKVKKQFVVKFYFYCALFYSF